MDNLCACIPIRAAALSATALATSLATALALAVATATAEITGTTAFVWRLFFRFFLIDFCLRDYGYFWSFFFLPTPIWQVFFRW